ncbi:Hypothetical predicted protein [Pelobates cultripes]|uniref:Uncharacterized protein n=1 Tax=Pelobates cultripes TaxID=61616 RepID=A0AAD1SU18_PELCU|nr:Hypothetical predicted protein [Pelobates cultripes]
MGRHSQKTPTGAKGHAQPRPAPMEVLHVAIRTTEMEHRGPENSQASQLPPPSPLTTRDQ